MAEHDENLERYLRTFQPRAVRPLEVPGQADIRWPRRVAVAAAVVLAVGVSLWYAHRDTTKPSNRITSQAGRVVAVAPQTHLGTLPLTKLALDDSETFEALLADESRTVLPSMRGERSTLRVLAKE